MAPDAAAVRVCESCRSLYRTPFARCPTDGGQLQELTNDPLVGTEVGSYVVDALIGEGGMGRVYRARHARLRGRQVALKVLLGDQAATQEMRLRFAREAELASRLSHPNVVTVVDFGITPARLVYMAMELVSGPTLGELIETEGPLAIPRVIELARGLCLGLAHAHDLELVHRDFKPDNVIVTSTSVDGVTIETPRILDFGLAIASNDSPDQARLTQAGIALGTPTYAAPEQTHTEAVDHRADLFALGVTLYQMTAGVPPFTGTVLEIMHANAQREPPSIEERTFGQVNVPLALESVIRRLMRRNPEHRFVSAREVLAALDHIVDLPPTLTPMPPVVVTPPLPPPGAWRSPRWLAAVPVVIVAGAVAMWASRSPAPATAPRLEVTSSAEPIAAARLSSVQMLPAAPETPRVAIEQRRSAVPVPVVEAVAVVVPVVEVVPEPPPPSSAPEAPPPVTTPLRPSAPVPPAPTWTRPTAVTLATRAFDVRGSLSSSIVRRSLDRLAPALRTCYLTSASASQRGATTATASFQIDDTRRATEIKIRASWPTLATCVTTALREVRTQEAPDVGIARVSLELVFDPT